LNFLPSIYHSGYLNALHLHYNYVFEWFYITAKVIIGFWEAGMAFQCLMVLSYLLDCRTVVETENPGSAIYFDKTKCPPKRTLFLSHRSATTRRPDDYESSALPAELRWHIVQIANFYVEQFGNLPVEQIANLLHSGGIIADSAKTRKFSPLCVV
jgi:hypothetical protein